MYNFDAFSRYYASLLADVYNQPEDTEHAAWARDIINKWLPLVPSIKTVLDVGCGQAFVQPMFENFGVQYTGVTIGSDYLTALDLGRSVINADYNFLEYSDSSFDLVFSRHSLEHSPFPVLTLMEWYRVSKSFLMLILPNPEYWGWGGRNHYSVMNIDQTTFLLGRSGFHPIWEDHTDKELRFMCEKIRSMGK